MALNRIWILVAVTFLFSCSQPQSEEQSSAEKLAVTPTISVSTVNAKPLIFQFATATVDMCASKKQGKWIDNVMTDPVLIANSKLLGFSIGWVFVDGALANIAYPNTTGTGKGYNARKSDFPLPDGKTYEEYGGGILTGNYTTDFYVATFGFCRSWGVQSAVTLSNKTTWAENKWFIEQATSPYIKLSSEVNTSSWSYTDYLVWAKRNIDSIIKYFPDKKLIADEPTLFKTNKKSLEWRKNINPTTLPHVWGADTYWQLNDEMGLSTNQDNNIVKINTFFNDSVPNHIAKFKELFPGWAMVGGEVHIVDNREGTDSIVFINKSIVGSVTWGKFFEMFIKNQETQPLAIQMSMKNLSAVNENNTQAFRLLNKILKPGFNATAVIFENMGECTGASIQNIAEPKKHSLLINNLSKNTYTLEKVKIDGAGKSPTYTLERIYSSNGTWQGDCTKDSITSATIIIPACSTNIISFTVGRSTIDSVVK